MSMKKQIKWKSFLLTNGRYTLWHLANKDNLCLCGFKYEKEEYTDYLEQSEIPNVFTCDLCRDRVNNE